MIKDVFIAHDGQLRILKSSAFKVTFHHNLKQCGIDHIHFLLALSIGEILWFSTCDGWFIYHILRHIPVQNNIGMGWLIPPLQWCIDTIYKCLDTLLYLCKVKMIHFDKRCQIRVKRNKCLRSSPFVMYNTDKTYHLFTQCIQMSCRSTADVSLDTRYAKQHELTQ